MKKLFFESRYEKILSSNKKLGRVAYYIKSNEITENVLNIQNNVAPLRRSMVK